MNSVVERIINICEEFARSLMQSARREYARSELAPEVDNAVYALDASTIDLTLSLFSWAKFRTTKGAVKLHAMINLRGNLPAFATITDGKVHDAKAAPLVPIEPEGIYVVDRAYVDFDWLWTINQSKAYFVTRLKKSIKWIKQNIKVKSFYGTSPNAVKTQIWIAMSENLSSLSSSLYFIHPPVMYAVLNLVYVPQSILTLIVILLSIAISIPIIHLI